MLNITIDKVGINAVTARNELFPQERTFLEDLGGGRTLVKCEEIFGERASLYESSDDIAAILATAGTNTHITATVTGQGGIGFTGAQTISMAFPSTRVRIFPNTASTAYIRVISPAQDFSTTYDSSDTVAALLATL